MIAELANLEIFVYTFTDLTTPKKYIPQNMPMLPPIGRIELVKDAEKGQSYLRQSYKKKTKVLNAAKLEQI